MAIDSVTSLHGGVRACVQWTAGGAAGASGERAARRVGLASRSADATAPRPVLSSVDVDVAATTPSDARAHSHAAQASSTRTHR